MEEIIKDINILYYEINNIYLEMYKLELNNQKSSTSFLKLIDLLKEKINEEKKIFQILVSEYGDECSFLSKLDENNDSPFFKRLADYMKYYLDTNVEIYEEDSEEEVIEKIETFNYAKLYETCSRNIFLIYLSFLQEYLDNLNFISLKKKLLNYKYCNSFINHDVEISLIDNNFDVDKMNYVNLYLIADTLKLDRGTCDRIIFECYYDTVVTTISQLLSISDIEYNNDNKKTISLNNQCMLKAGLSMLSESDYNKLKNDIYKLINELSNDNNRISFELILQTLHERKQDKSRVRKISMRQLED